MIYPEAVRASTGPWRVLRTGVVSRANIVIALLKGVDGEGCADEMAA